MTDILNLQIPSPTFGGSTGGWLRAAETEEKYAITWTSKKEQIFENYSKVGNTISASIPIALKDASSKNKLKKNNLIIVAGYGVGLSWGSALIKWNKIK